MSHDGSVAWSVVHRAGTAADLHALELPVSLARTVWVMELARPALVLGSTQSPEVVDHAEVARRGIDVTTRRSGGGAVLLDPRSSVWIDVLLPRDDVHWDDDVNRSFHWLGDAWVRALGTFGIDAAVHAGPLRRTDGSALVCFAGLGPGEVTVDGAKAVGISQRRTRAGARFQCVVPLAAGGPPSAVVDLLVEPTGEDARADLRRHLDATVVPLALAAPALVDALLAALPT